MRVDHSETEDIGESMAEGFVRGSRFQSMMIRHDFSRYRVGRRSQMGRFQDRELRMQILGQVPSRVRQARNVITLGFDRAVDLSLLISGLGHQKRNRVYKVVKLGPETGEAEFIKIRENVG